MNSKQIIIVEDEQAIRDMYDFKLSKAGFTVITAKNGHEGLEQIKKHNPDLVLLDLRMPQMDGEEMLLRMRDTDWGQDIRVVILTNISRDEAPISLRQLGVEDYIVKAMVTPQQVLDKIQHILRR